MPLRITNSTTDVASINRWAEDVESRLGATSKQSNHAVTAIKQILATPAPVSTSITDGLVHGDKVWESDSAYVLIRDDFNGSNQTTSGNIGEIGWTLITSNNGALNATRGEPFSPLSLGAFNMSNSATASGFSNINLLGTQVRDTSFPLFDYPNWKATFVFALTPGDLFAAGSRFLQKSLYVGLGANPSQVGVSTWNARPHIFMGLRYDTDTIAPAISDTTFKFEVVTNFSTTGTTRINTQGTVVNTGITPALGIYRLEIQCLTAGVITMSLNGSAPVSFNVPTITTGGSNAVIVTDGVASLNMDDGGGTTNRIVVFSANSKTTFSGWGAPFTSFNGPQTIIAVGDNSQTTHAAILTGLGNTGNTAASGNIAGFPAVVPIFSFGNDTQAAPVSASTSLSCDFFSLIWNPGVGSGTGTPVATKSRYW